MTHFRYRAFDRDGREQRGETEAVDAADAARRLAGAGLRPFEVTPIEGLYADFARPSRKPIDAARLFADLDQLLTAGFTIDAALKATIAGEASRSRRARLTAVLDRLTAGGAIGEAFALLPELPPALIALLDGGAAGGRLDRVVAELARGLGEEQKARQRLRDALVYPAFLVVAMVVAIGLLTFVLVPALAPVFESTGEPPPGLVGVLTALHDLVERRGAILAATGLGLIVVGILMWRRPGAVHARTRLVLSLPFLGGILRRQALARTMRVLSSMLAQGVPIKKALRLASDTLPEGEMRRAMAQMVDAVAAGGDIASAAAATGLFDEATKALVVLGDEANALPDALARAARLNETAAERLLDGLLTLLTPAITLVMGLLVGGLAVSVMNALMRVNSIAFDH